MRQHYQDKVRLEGIFHLTSLRAIAYLTVNGKQITPISVLMQNTLYTLVFRGSVETLSYYEHKHHLHMKKIYTYIINIANSVFFFKSKNAFWIKNTQAMTGGLFLPPHHDLILNWRKQRSQL